MSYLLNRCRVMTSLAGPHDTLDWSISHGIGPAQVGPFSLAPATATMAEKVSASDSQQSQSQQGLFPVRQGDTENQQDARLRCNLRPPPGRRAIGDRRQKLGSARAQRRFFRDSVLSKDTGRCPDPMPLRLDSAGGGGHRYRQQCRRKPTESRHSSRSAPSACHRLPRP